MSVFHVEVMQSDGGWTRWTQEGFTERSRAEAHMEMMRNDSPLFTALNTKVAEYETVEERVLRLAADQDCEPHELIRRLIRFVGNRSLGRDLVFFLQSNPDGAEGSLEVFGRQDD